MSIALSIPRPSFARLSLSELAGRLVSNRNRMEANMQANEWLAVENESLCREMAPALRPESTVRLLIDDGDRPRCLTLMRTAGEEVLDYEVHDLRPVEDLSRCNPIGTAWGGLHLLDEQGSEI